MKTFKKVLKVLAIIAAIAAAIAGIYFAVTKLIEKKKAKDAENIETMFAASENFDGDFLTEAVVEEAPAEEEAEEAPAEEEAEEAAE